MADNGHNGSRIPFLATNVLIAEFWKFLAWIVIFLWFSSTVNTRISNNTGTVNGLKERIAKIETKLEQKDAEK